MRSRALQAWILPLGAASLLVSGCSFDSTFFPVDERPAHALGARDEHIPLRSSDGKHIQHLLLRPVGEARATIFVLHGSGSTVANWVTLLEPLRDAGYLLFLMEYRGFGESEGVASHERVAEDARRAFTHLRGLEAVRDKTLLLLGQSYGGQLAVSLAAGFPDQVDGLVLEGTFSSFEEVAVYATPWWARPMTRLVFVNPYRCLELIAEPSVPKLIIHSRDDAVVPYAMAEQLFAAAGGRKELWTIRGAHTDALLDYPEEFIARVDRLAGLQGSDPPASTRPERGL